MSDVSLSQITKSYGPLEVIHGVDLSIASGEFVVFVGPSGCGKSTLLRMIAGLESITSGEVSIGGKVVNNVASAKRGISMVFQSYALYPHMSVRGNMAFGLELSRTPKDEIDARVMEAARILQIEPYLDRMPRALSGGQRQRVAIGRAIVRKPNVFLFDEPLSNLDAALRTQTRVEIARLHQTLGATMIYVTHDQTEAMTLADRIVVLNEGRIEQVGTPLELYHKPANTFVAGFIASQRMNFLPVRAEMIASKTHLYLPDGRSLLTSIPGAERATTLGVRPEDLVTSDAADAPFSGRLDVIEHFGEHALAYLTLSEGPELVIKLIGAPDLTPGAVVSAQAADENLHLFDAEGRAIRGS
ncbi:MAG: sn-glycerol-3-phosphate ABC transporter ATP-binding protein UgpC [Maritimibacter sp.]